MKLRIFSLIAALALGGLLAGSLAVQAQDTNAGGAPKQGKKGAPTVDEQLARMKEQLNLTDEQTPKVKALLEDTQKKRAELRGLAQDERREKGRTLMEEQNAKMKAILTPQQFEKWQSMRQQFGKKGGQGKSEQK